jgi:ribose/xylose/arabinose/galactoside ABC-type transport system permease subunit
MNPISDTHRRAAIRGREAVAHWRIRSAVWAARVFAALFAVISILPLLRSDRSDWSSAIIMAVLAAAILGGSELLRRGSRAAASLLLGLFVLAKLSSWLLAGEPLWHGVLWTVIITAALVNGVWGTFELAAVRREAATIPPAPERGSSPQSV